MSHSRGGLREVRKPVAANFLDDFSRFRCTALPTTPREPKRCWWGRCMTRQRRRSRRLERNTTASCGRSALRWPPLGVKIASFKRVNQLFERAAACKHYTNTTNGHSWFHCVAPCCTSIPLKPKHQARLRRKCQLGQACWEEESMSWVHHRG